MGLSIHRLYIGSGSVVILTTGTSGFFSMYTGACLCFLMM